MPLTIPLIAHGEFIMVLDEVVAVIPSKIPSEDSIINNESAKKSAI